jgi:hypothetical protein
MTPSVDVTASNLVSRVTNPPTNFAASATGTCLTAMVAFVTEIKTSLTYQTALTSNPHGFNCPTGTWDAASHPALWKGYKCGRLIAKALSDFNSSAGNGYDIFTGDKDNRCSVTNWFNIESRFLPFPAMVASALLDFSSAQSLYTVWTGRVTALQSGGSSFADVLELLPLNSITSGTCKQCYVTFYSELYALMRTDSAARTACATKYLVADNTACA